MTSEDYISRIPTLLYQEHLIASWTECRDAPIALGEEWFYRGQQNGDWLISSTFERIAKKTSCQPGTYKEIEKELINEFKRRVHHYESNHPANENTLEWLAMMQHYGAPTRLIDFTKSFYVALFFAFEDIATKNNEYASVWAIQAHTMTPAVDKLIELIIEKNDMDAHIPGFKNLFSKDKFAAREKLLNYSIIHQPVLMPTISACVFPVEPFRLNPRVATQKGLFMVQNDITIPFHETLLKSIYDLSLHMKDPSVYPPEVLNLKYKGDPKNIGNAGIVVHFKISTKLRNEALNDLDRMNINHSTLFPGLDGFTRSMGRLFEKKATQTA